MRFRSILKAILSPSPVVLVLLALGGPALAGVGGSEIGNGRSVPEIALELPVPNAPGDKAAQRPAFVFDEIVYSAPVAREGETIRFRAKLPARIRAPLGASCKAVFGSPALSATRVIAEYCRVVATGPEGALEMEGELTFPIRTTTRSYSLQSIEWGVKSGAGALGLPPRRQTIEVLGTLMSGGADAPGLWPGTRIESRDSEGVRPGEVFVLSVPLPQFATPLIQGALQFRLEQLARGNWYPGELPLLGPEPAQAAFGDWLPARIEADSTGLLRVFIRVPESYRYATRIEFTRVILLTEGWEELVVDLPAGFGIAVRAER